MGYAHQSANSDPKKRPTATALLKHPFCTPDPSFKFTVNINLANLVFKDDYANTEILGLR